MTEEERLQILKWANSFVPRRFVFNNSSKLRILSHGRADFDLCTNDPNVSVPSIIFDIKKRIEKKEGLQKFENDNHFGHFMSFVFKGGCIHKHTDPNYDDKKLFHVRFNVIISLPKKGGTTYYAGSPLDSPEGSYALCRSGIDYHWSDVNEDNIPRIALSFGYALPGWKVNDLCSDPKIGTYKRLYPLFDTFFN
jgi:hypothetical protein